MSAYNQACARVCAIRIGRYTTFENVAGQEKFYNLLSTKYITIVARLHTVLTYIYCPPHETLMDTFYTVAVASDSPLKAGGLRLLQAPVGLALPPGLGLFLAYQLFVRCQPHNLLLN